MHIKRSIAFLLVVCMIFSLAVSAFAATPETESTTELPTIQEMVEESSEPVIETELPEPTETEPTEPSTNSDTEDETEPVPEETNPDEYTLDEFVEGLENGSIQPEDLIIENDEVSIEGLEDSIPLGVAEGIMRRSLRSSAPPLPIEFTDSAPVRLLRYVGYDMDFMIANNYQYWGAQKVLGIPGPGTGYGHRSQMLGYNPTGDPTGLETINQNSYTNMRGYTATSKTGKMPKVANMNSTYAGNHNNGTFCCASFVTYYYMNYLYNVEGLPFNYLINKMHDVNHAWVYTSVLKWQNMLNALDSEGKAVRYDAGTTSWKTNAPLTEQLKRDIAARFFDDYDGPNKFVLPAGVACGDIIIFDKINNSASNNHIAIYLGLYNNHHYIVHVGGNGMGPEVTTLDTIMYDALTDNDSKIGSIPVAFYHIKSIGDTEPVMRKTSTTGIVSNFNFKIWGNTIGTIYARSDVNGKLFRTASAKSASPAGRFPIFEDGNYVFAEYADEHREGTTSVTISAVSNNSNAQMRITENGVTTTGTGSITFTTTNVPLGKTSEDLLAYSTGVLTLSGFSNLKSLTITFNNAPKSRLTMEKLTTSTGVPVDGWDFKIYQFTGNKSIYARSNASGDLFRTTGAQSGTAYYQNQPYYFEPLQDGRYVFTEFKTNALHDNTYAGLSSFKLVINMGEFGTSGVHVKRDNVELAHTVSGNTITYTIPAGDILNETANNLPAWSTGTLTLTGINNAESIVVSYTNAPDNYIQIMKRSTMQGNPIISGVQFTLEYNTSQSTTGWQAISTITTDENGIARWDGLNENYYYRIKEVAVPEGYTVPSNNIVWGGTTGAQIPSSHHVELNLLNGRTSGSGTVVKTDAYNSNKFLPATFRVYGIGKNGKINRLFFHGTITTDPITGTGTLSGLPFGTYWIEEYTAPEGYQLNSTLQSFTITEQNPDATVYFENVPETCLTVWKTTISNAEIEGVRLEIRNDAVDQNISWNSNDMNGRIKLTSDETGLFWNVNTQSSDLSDSFLTSSDIYLVEYPVDNSRPVNADSFMRIYRQNGTHTDIDITWTLRNDGGYQSNMIHITSLAYGAQIFIQNDKTDGSSITAVKKTPNNQNREGFMLNVCYQYHSGTEQGDYDVFLMSDNQGQFYQCNYNGIPITDAQGNKIYSAFARNGGFNVTSIREVNFNNKLDNMYPEYFKISVKNKNTGSVIYTRTWSTGQLSKTIDGDYYIPTWDNNFPTLNSNYTVEFEVLNEYDTAQFAGKKTTDVGPVNNFYFYLSGTNASGWSDYYFKSNEDGDWNCLADNEINFYMEHYYTEEDNRYWQTSIIPGTYYLTEFDYGNSAFDDYELTSAIITIKDAQGTIISQIVCTENDIVYAEDMYQYAQNQVLGGCAAYDITKAIIIPNEAYGGSIEITCHNESKKGSVHLRKVDGYSLDPLDEITFNIYHENEDFIGEMINVEGGYYYLNDLPYGNYYLEEETIPDGYNNINNIAFTIDDNHQEVWLGRNDTRANQLDWSYVTGRPTPIDICPECNESLLDCEVVCNDDGTHTCICDNCGEEVLNNCVSFGELTEDGSVYYECTECGYTWLNITPINVLVWNIPMGIPLKIIKKNEVGTPLAGAKFQLQRSANGTTWSNYGAVQTTNANEEIIYTNLPVGATTTNTGYLYQYRLIETQAPTGYKLDSTPILIGDLTDYIGSEVEAEIEVVNEAGSLDGVKTSEDGNVEGFCFHITGPNFDKYFITDNQGVFHETDANWNYISIIADTENPWTYGLTDGLYTITEVNRSLSGGGNLLDDYELTNLSITMTKKDNTVTTVNYGSNNITEDANGNYSISSLIVGLTDLAHISLNAYNTNENHFGSVSWQKLNASNEDVLTTAGFTIYQDINENGTYEANIDTLYMDEETVAEYLSNGTYTIDEIECGKYILAETTIPDGFVVDFGIYYAFEILPDTETKINGGVIYNTPKSSISAIKTTNAGSVEGHYFCLSSFEHVFYFRSDANGVLRFINSDWIAEGKSDAFIAAQPEPTNWTNGNWNQWTDRSAYTLSEFDYAGNKFATSRMDAITITFKNANNGIISSQTLTYANGDIEYTSSGPYQYPAYIAENVDMSDIVANGSIAIEFHNTFVSKVSWSKVSYKGIALGNTGFQIQSCDYTADNYPLHFSKFDEDGYVTDEFGNRLTFTGDAHGDYEVWNLPYGDYILHETSPVTGYDEGGTWEFAISDTVPEIVLEDSPLINLPKPIDIVIVKENDKEEKLQGVEFQLQRSTNGTTWTNVDTPEVTNSNGEIHWNNIVIYYKDATTNTYKDYYFRVVETNDPMGYIPLSAPVLLSEDGTLDEYIGQTSITKTITNNPSPIKIRVIKNDDQGHALEGATFKLERLTGNNSWTSLGNIISNANGIVDFGSQPVVDASGDDYVYRITELSAPNGYEIDEVLIFQGTLRDYVGQLEEPVANQPVLAFSATNTPSPIDIIVIKNDDKGQPLENAQLTLQCSTDNTNWVDVDTKPTAANGRVIFDDMPVAINGVDYYYQVIETAPPAGYVKILTPVTIGSLRTEIGNESIEVVFQNLPKPIELRVHKTGENQTALAGAKFTIEQYLNGQQTTSVNFPRTLQTDSNGNINFGEVPVATSGQDYTYRIVEIEAPEGYIIDNAVIFNGTLRNYVGQQLTVTFNATNTKIRGSVTWTKTDALTTHALNGAKFAIYKDTNGNGTHESNESAYITGLTSTNGVFSVTGIPYGNYVLVETEAPANYQLDTTHYPFSITTNNALVHIRTNDQFPNMPILVPIRVHKVNVADNSLSGATFMLERTTNNTTWEVVDSITTDASGYATWSNLPVVKDGIVYTYRLTETGVPTNYIADPTIAPFTLEGLTNGVTKEITVYNESNIRIKFTKNNENNQPLAGATFVLEQSTNNTTWTAFATATSSINGLVAFDNVPIAYLENGEYHYYYYRIRETNAPSGYKVLANPIALNTLEAQLGNAEYDIGIVTNALELGSVEWNKIDVTTNENLKGATFTIYRDGAAVGTYQTTDSVYQTGISGTNGHFLVSNLPEGNYLLKETVAPEGYDINPTYYPFTIVDEQTTQVNTTGNIPNTPSDITIRIPKTDDIGTPLQGAKFELKQYLNSTLVNTWTMVSGNDGNIIFGPLPVTNGTNDYRYVITETNAPTGYTIKNAIIFDETLRDYIGETEIVLPTINLPEIQIQITKQSDKGTPLANAKFRLDRSEDGQVWTTIMSNIASNTSGIANFGTLPISFYDDNDAVYKNYYYRIVETAAPTNYQIINPIVFEGTLRDKVGQTVFNKTVVNNPADIIISVKKRNDKKTRMLAGAEFTLEQALTSQGPWVEVARETTGTNGMLTFRTSTQENTAATPFPVMYEKNGTYYDYYYRITETVVPDGYRNTSSGTVKWTGTLRNYAGKYVAIAFDWINMPVLELEVIKSDDQEGEKKNLLSGAVFTLYRSKDNQVWSQVSQRTSDADGNISFGDVDMSYYNSPTANYQDYFYKIVETTPAPGYVLPENPVVFSGTLRNYEGVVTELTTEVSNAPDDIELKIYKTDNNNIPLANAVFKLEQSTDGENWTALQTNVTSAANGIVNFGEVPVANEGVDYFYRITETAAPDGYLIDDPNIFEGTLRDYVGLQTEVTFNAINNVSGIDITLTKNDEKNRPLAGAIFVLERRIYGTNDEWEAITTRVSDSYGNISFGQQLYQVGTSIYEYRLHETAAPSGYTIENEYPVPAFKLTDYVGQSVPHFTVTNITTVDISVLKKNTQGTPLEGVAFQLYQVQNEEWVEYGNEVLTDNNGTAEWKDLPIAYWDEEEEEYVDYQYRIIETKAKPGYSLLKDPVFTGTLRDYEEEHLLRLLAINNVTFRLPQTGAEGTWKLTIIGIVGMAVAIGVIVVIVGKKKEDNEDDEIKVEETDE